MQWFEIFCLVTGVIYLILEIRQSNVMWIVGLLTSAAAIVVFHQSGIYAQMILNVYYFAVSFYGLYSWKRDAAAMEASGRETGEKIHLNRFKVSSALWYIVAGAVAAWGLVHLLEWLDDPMSRLDAYVAVLSAVATMMLSRSYIEQWLLWIVADSVSVLLCWKSGLHWMAFLYAFYAASAIYGFIHWKRHGVYISK